MKDGAFPERMETNEPYLVSIAFDGKHGIADLTDDLAENGERMAEDFSTLGLIYLVGRIATMPGTVPFRDVTNAIAHGGTYALRVSITETTYVEERVARVDTGDFHRELRNEREQQIRNVDLLDLFRREISTRKESPFRHVLEITVEKERPSQQHGDEKTVMTF